MSPELDKLLCNRYPAIFAKRHRPMTGSSMHWGFTCGVGWFDLIGELCEKLQAASDAGEMPQPVAEQVKQKLGELRFFVSSPSSFLARALIEAVRERSALTCETCGEPGVLRWQHGVQTLCDLQADPGSQIVEASSGRPKRHE